MYCTYIHPDTHYQLVVATRTICRAATSRETYVRISVHDRCTFNPDGINFLMMHERERCVWIVATPFACAEELHPQVVIWCFLFSSSCVRLHGRGERFNMLQEARCPNNNCYFESSSLTCVFARGVILSDGLNKSLNTVRISSMLIIMYLPPVYCIRNYFAVTPAETRNFLVLVVSSLVSTRMYVPVQMSSAGSTVTPFFPPSILC